MPTTVRLLSPVKLNLFLHITGQRQDGYHLLQTIFQLLDYGDQMEFSSRQDARLVRIDEHDFDLPQLDLSIQAAEALRIKANKPALGATIRLKKNVPPGSGLGAGSSNAATTLLCLNQLWQLGFSLQQLAETGARLGADVPVFIYGQTAWAEGVGEKISAIDGIDSWYCVLVPDINVATAAVFSSPALHREHPVVTLADYQHGRCSNALETATAQIYPQVAEALDYLRQYGDAHMSGTGASVFVPVDDQAQGEKILDQSPCDGFIAHSINPGPVHRALKIL